MVSTKPAVWNGKFYKRKNKVSKGNIIKDSTWRDSNTGKIYKDIKTVNGKTVGVNLIAYEPRKGNDYGADLLSKQESERRLRLAKNKGFIIRTS